MRYLFLFATILCITNCTKTANYDPQKIGTRGANLASLSARWGAPNYKYLSPEGQIVYIYTLSPTIKSNYPPRANTIGVNLSRQGRPVIITTSNPVKVDNKDAFLQSCVVVVKADKSGNILAVRKQGSACFDNPRFNAWETR